MSRVIVTDMSPGQLFRHALAKARAASSEIERLKTVPLSPGETLHDRALKVAAIAHVLAENFDIIETLADMACEPEPISPSQSREEQAPGHRGVHRGDDPNTN